MPIYKIFVQESKGRDQILILFFLKHLLEIKGLHSKQNKVITFTSINNLTYTLI